MGKWLLGNQQLLGDKHSPCQDKHVLSGSRLCICCRAGSDASWQLCAAGCEVAFYLRLDILCLTERLRGLHHTSWHALRTLVGLETMHSMRMIFTTPSRSACQHRRHPGELTALLVQSANVKLAAHTFGWSPAWALSGSKEAQAASSRLPAFQSVFPLPAGCGRQALHHYADGRRFSR